MKNKIAFWISVGIILATNSIFHDYGLLREVGDTIIAFICFCMARIEYLFSSHNKAQGNDGNGA